MTDLGDAIKALMSNPDIAALLAKIKRLEAENKAIKAS